MYLCTSIKKGIKMKYLGEERIKKIEKITMTDYEEEDGIVPIENVDCIIDDLLNKIEYLEKELKEKTNELIEVKEQYCEKYNYD